MALLPVTAAAVAFLTLRTRRRAPEPVTSVEARMGRLDDELAAAEADGARRRAFAQELTECLRAAADRAEGRGDRRAFTDAEWLTHHLEAGTLHEAEAARLEGLLERLEGIRYGDAAPTRLALDELLNGARGFLVGLDTRMESERSVKGNRSTAPGPGGGGEG